MESKKRSLNQISVHDIMMKFKSKSDFYSYLTQHVSTNDSKSYFCIVVVILHPTSESHKQAIPPVTFHGIKEGFKTQSRLLHQCPYL